MKIWKKVTILKLQITTFWKPKKTKKWKLIFCKKILECSIFVDLAKFRHFLTKHFCDHLVILHCVSRLVDFHFLLKYVFFALHILLLMHNFEKKTNENIKIGIPKLRLYRMSKLHGWFERNCPIRPTTFQTNLWRHCQRTVRGTWRIWVESLCPRRHEGGRNCTKCIHQRWPNANVPGNSVLLDYLFY